MHIKAKGMAREGSQCKTVEMKGERYVCYEMSHCLSSSHSCLLSKCRLTNLLSRRQEPQLMLSLGDIEKPMVGKRKKFVIEV